MADNKKISELTAATTPLAGTEEAEILQGGVNKRVPVSNFGGSQYNLDSVTTVTTGGTITLDFSTSLKVQRIFIGSASFGTAKAIALSNAGSALVFQMVLTLTNVAAVLTFPSTFIMLNSESLSRWNNGAKTFTPSATGKHEFSGLWDGTNWLMLVSTPYV